MAGLLIGISRVRCGSAHPSLSRCISRTSVPSCNAKAECCIKTLKIEAVYLMGYETFADVTADLPRALNTSTTLGGSTPRSAT